MASADDVRRIALALPEALESSHFDVADFRVNRKIFCTLPGDQPRAVLKLTPEDQHNLLDGQAVERVGGSWGLKGWTYVWYEKVDAARLETLIRVAWATVAPKRLLR